MHHQEFQLLQTGLNVVGVGVCQNRVFPQNVHGLDFTGVGLIEHLRDHQADIRRQGNPPGLFKLLPHCYLFGTQQLS
jgi:hypothetical protein